MATKTIKCYKVVAGEYDTKDEAIIDLIEAKKTVADSTIIISGNKYLVDCGTFPNKENAEILKNTINTKKTKIISL